MLEKYDWFYNNILNGKTIFSKKQKPNEMHLISFERIA